MKNISWKTILYFIFTCLLTVLAVYSASQCESLLTGMYPAWEHSIDRSYYRDQGKYQETLAKSLAANDVIFFHGLYNSTYWQDGFSFNDHSDADVKLIKAAYFQHRLGGANFSSSFTENWLQSAQKNEPDNGWYDMLQAIQYFEQATNYSDKMWQSPKNQSQPEVTEEQALKKAFDHYLAALNKPHFNCYEKEVKARRRLALPVKDFISLYRFYCLYRQFLYIATYDQLCKINKILLARCETLINEKKNKSAEHILDTWPRLAKLELKSDNQSLHYDKLQFWQLLHEKVPPLYVKLGKTDKAGVAKIKMKKIVDLYQNAIMKRRTQIGPVMLYGSRGEKHGSHFFSSFALREFHSNPLYLKLEYLFFDQAAILFVIPALATLCVILLFGGIFGWLKWSEDIEFNFLKRQAAIIAGSIILPLALWLIVTRIPAINSRDYNIRANSWGFAFRSLLLFWTALTLPFTAAGLCARMNTDKTKRTDRCYISWTIFSLLLTGWLLVGAVMPRIIEFIPDMSISQANFGSISLFHHRYYLHYQTYQLILFCMVVGAIILCLLIMREISSLIFAQKKLRKQALLTMLYAAPAMAVSACLYFFCVYNYYKHLEYKIIPEVKNLKFGIMDDYWTKPPDFNSKLRAIMNEKETEKNSILQTTTGRQP